MTSLLVEGGAAVNGAFFRRRRFSKIISYVSVKLVGGTSAPTPFGGIGYDTMDEAIRLSGVEVKQIDENDLRMIGYPKWD